MTRWPHKCKHGRRGPCEACREDPLRKALIDQELKKRLDDDEEVRKKRRRRKRKRQLARRRVRKMKERQGEVYTNCTMETYFPEATESDVSLAAVRIGPGKEIVVSYAGENGSQPVYVGEETGPGHYLLTCSSQKGRATLHRLEESSVYLEGYWEEGGHTGMWRIKLAR